MYINYGDYDFFEYGALVEKTDNESGYNVLYCQPIYDEYGERFLFADCYVDISDDWIDKEEVQSCCGETNDPMQFAVECIDFYGTHEFAYYWDTLPKSENDVKQILRNLEINSKTCDRLKVTW